MFDMNISIAINHKYTKYAYIMLTSLFFHHKDLAKSVTVYILQSDLTEEDKALLQQLAERYDQIVSFLQVNIDDYGVELPTDKNWSIEMYYRLLLGELLPKEVTRILYLDVDIIINKPLLDLFQIDMQEMQLAVADDPAIQNNYSTQQREIFANFAEPIRYFNSGVILMDLKKLRGHYTFTTYCKVAEQFSYQLSNPDQDLLNYVHAGNVYYIDNSRYNVFSQIAEMKGGYEQIKKEAAIVHYVGRKPWKYNGVHYGVEKLWWDYAKLTPFYYELMESVFLEGLHDESYDPLMALIKENKQLKLALQESTELCRKLFSMVNG